MSTLDFTAIGRDRGASRMLQNLGKDADVAGRKMQGLNHTSKGMGGGFKFAAAGAAAVGTGLLAAAGAAVGYGLKVAAGNEQAKIGFTTMLGSGKKAEAFLKDLEAFAAKTPFEFPELQKAASSLISVGVNSSKVIPIMTTLGNVTSGMGTGAEGVQRATVALQQMQSAGRITAEDLNQLRDAGIPLKTVMAAISAETGTSSKKLFEMSRNGKLGKKELDGLMASLESGKGFEKFNGLMDAQSKSLTGMLSTLKDTFGMGMAKAIEPALPFLKGAIGAVTKSLADFFGWVATHQEDVVDGLVAVGNGVLGVSKTFLILNRDALRALAGIADGVATVLEGMDRMALGDQFSGTVGALRGFAKGARDAGNSIDSNLIPSIDSAHREWNKFGADQKTKAALRDANQAITNAVGKTTDALKKNGRTVDINTTKGQHNRTALRNLASAQVAYRDKLIATGASTKRVDTATDNARKSFIQTAIRMGASRREAERLARQFGLLDRRIDTISNRHVRIKFTAQSFSIGGVKYRVNTTSPSSVGRSGSRAEMAGHPAIIPPPRGGGAGDPFLRVGVPHNVPKNAMMQPSVINRWSKRYADEGGKLLARAVAKRVEAASSGGLGSGPAAFGAGQAAAIRAGRALGANSVGTYPGHHPSMAKARDFMISSRSEGNRIAGHMWGHASKYGIWYVIWNRRIASRTRPGAGWAPYTRSNPHTDHVHVSWYDKGGMLRPGWTMAYNGTGRNERVVPAGGGGGTVVNNYTINATHYSDAQALQRELVNLNKQGRLAVTRR